MICRRVPPVPSLRAIYERTSVPLIALTNTVDNVSVKSSRSGNVFGYTSKCLAMSSTRKRRQGRPGTGTNIS
jgi:hypothetical protein